MLSDELVKAIDEDIRIARKELAEDDIGKYAAHDFFKAPIPNDSQQHQHHEINGKLWIDDYDEKFSMG